MGEEIDIEKIDYNIKTMKKMAEELTQMGDDFPALKRNTARILASIKMLEINISDIIDL